MVKFTEAMDYFFRVFTRDIQLKKAYNSPNTLSTYDYALRNLLRYLAEQKLDKKNEDNQEETAKLMEKIDLGEIDEDRIKDFLYHHLKQGARGSTLNKYLYIFRSFWKVAHKKYPQINNIIKDIDRAVVKKGPSPHLSEKHIRLFLAYLDQLDPSSPLNFRNKIFFKIIIKFGCRISEALNLNRDALTLTPHRIDIRFLGKGNKVRITPLPLLTPDQVAFRDEMVHYLGTVLAKFKPKRGHEKSLFLSKRNVRWHRNSAELQFNKYMRALGLKQYGYVVHSLRHSLASHLLNEGVGLPTVSEILGHANTQVTATIYSHCDREHISRGMEKTF